MSRKVVVTGIGLVTPLGLSSAKTWERLISGESAIRQTHHHDSLPINIAAQISPKDLPSPPPLLSPCPLFAAYALLAVREALIDARLYSSTDHPLFYDPNTSGVSIGVGMAHLPEIVRASDHLQNNAYRKISPYLVPRILPNTPSGLISLQHCLRGPILTPATACAAGAHAICDGLHAIQRGDAELMVVGGAEAAIHPIAVAGFARARALASKESAPFDAHRSGFVLGEGSAILTLESSEHAKKRGAAAYAEVLGCSATGDAFHITSPSPDGDGAIRAMKGALRNAKRPAHDVDYINAHATGTTMGDAIERKAIASLFSQNEVDKQKTVVSSTKGATGHLLGAAGAVEAAFTILSISENVVPPTVGLKALDVVDEVTKLGWDDIARYVPSTSLKKEVRFALSNSFGFGGTNACLAFGEPPEEISKRGIQHVPNSTKVG